MRRPVRWQTAVAAPAAGFVAGLASGLWLRLLMRVVALTAGSDTARIAVGRKGALVDAPIPVFTVGGTVDVVLFPAVAGAVLGLLALVARTIMPALRRNGGLVLGAAMLAFPGSIMLATTPEFAIGRQWLNTILGAVTPFVYAVTFERLIRLTERSTAEGALDEAASFA